MYCLKCGYNLRGLGESRCPECGRTFNASDPQSFSRIPIHQGGIAIWLSILSMICPFAISISLLITYTVAGFQLGHAPTPMVDDPKGLTGFAMSCYRFTNSLMDVLSSGFFIAPIVLFIYIFVARDRKLRRKEFILLVIAFSMPVLTIGLWVSPIGNWFAD